MEEKENEKDIADRELSSFSLSSIDEKEKKLVNYLAEARGPLFLKSNLMWLNSSA